MFYGVSNNTSSAYTEYSPAVFATNPAEKSTESDGLEEIIQKILAPFKPSEKTDLLASEARFEALYNTKVRNATPEKISQNFHLPQNATVFEQAVAFTLEHEGGMTDDPHDPGGRTNLGILESEYREYFHRPDADVSKITLEEARQIYYNKYWLGSGADKIQDPKLAIVYFDTAVLHGPGAAKSFLARSGGDVQKFVQLRFDSYASSKNNKYFGNGWRRRSVDLAQAIGTTINRLG